MSEASPKLLRERVPVSLVAEHLLRRPAAPSRLYLLLHGYAQAAAYLWGKCESWLPSDAAVLAPNGPFPMPQRTDNGYRLGFSWYFYDAMTDEYYLDMEIGTEYCLGLVKTLGLSHLPATIIGFSQGGYLAPFITQRLETVDHVLGVGCEFLAPELSLPIRGVRFDQVHGAEDDHVSIEVARRYHAELRAGGNAGEFVTVEEGSHRIDAAVATRMRRLLGIA